MRAYERFVNYVKYNTQSSDTTGTHPSTDGQPVLAKVLLEELTALGCADVKVSPECYVYAKLPATQGYEQCKKIGFIAHMDTAPDFSGDGVCPILHEGYDGGDILLPKGGQIISPDKFPHLASFIGKTVITTDGTTLLGADDKAGIAEILTAINIIKEENIPHGQISIAFTPDEEIGEGADFFDVDGFDADLAYTMDGGAEGSLEYENFNAASATFKINGFSIHPGDAKGSMINAALVAMEINSYLPNTQIPALTEGYEGFFHVTDLKAECAYGEISYIVRDHDPNLFDAKINTLLHIEKTMNEKYGAGTVALTVKEQYRNMRQMIEPVMHVVENAKEAIRAVGLEPKVSPIRGGTDGARLSFMGLPCPNLGTGGHSFHGPFEHICAESMDVATDIIVNIIKIYSKKD